MSEQERERKRKRKRKRDVSVTEEKVTEYKKSVAVRLHYVAEV